MDTLDAAINQQDAAEAILKADRDRAHAEAEEHKALIRDQEAEVDRRARERRDAALKESVRFGGYRPSYQETIIGRVGDLMYAASKGDCEWLQKTIMKNASLDELDPFDGRSALHAAAMFGRIEGVWHLLAAGADPALKTARGQTARELAAARGHDEVVELFDNDHWLQYASEAQLQDSSRQRVEMSGAQLRDYYVKKKEEQSAGPAYGERA
ncbi:hypothetical protein H2201_006092 [Coniosporium apollinis]|uniref:Ankyrin repeat domain-containing protein n=1 Tax=Coniosporium apollinis TaxID=61459 RepID=A0ABQ9NN03_9PEZI|nr:hypothetical protein H2201_006092 [Coniosporium apollinis]